MSVNAMRATAMAWCVLLAGTVAGCEREARAGVAAAAVSAPAPPADSLRPEPRDDGPAVLVAFYTQTGTTRRLADAVAAGARGVAGARVILAPIDSVRPEDLRSADALVLGSPTHWANMATPMRAFIDRWPELGFQGRDRIGAAFATGGGSGGGKEMVVTSMLLAMLNHGMIVVGPIFNEDGFEYGNFGVAATTGPVTDQALAELDLDAGRALGRRVAEVAASIRRN